MTKQLPIIHKTNAVIVTTASSSLLGRGLAAVAQTKQDICYRQARETYNRITGRSSWDARFKVELLPTQDELLKDIRLQQLQPFYNLIQQLAKVSIEFQQLANQGYGKAYFPLSCMYQGGQGISKNFEKADYYAQLAFDWCFANTSLNDPEIWTDFGHVYYQKQDKEQAAFWYGKAAEQGYAEAQKDLGLMYLYGHGVEEDREKSAFWYLKAAEQGCAEAQYALVCVIYPAGEEAIFWCRKAAEQGHLDAQALLGYVYKSGFDVEENDEQAEFWYRKAAEQGCAEGQYELGCIYEIEQAYTQAVFWYRKAAEQGHVRAQCELGSMYKNGLGVEKNYEQAKFWCWRAVEQGSVDAKNMLGVIYHNEIDEGNVKQNYEQAIFWYRMAAEQDNAVAQSNLGWMYENGLGVEQDNEQAVSWYLKAANQGNRHAKIFLKKLGINWQEK